MITKNRSAFYNESGCAFYNESGSKSRSGSSPRFITYRCWGRKWSKRQDSFSSSSQWQQKHPHQQKWEGKGRPKVTLIPTPIHNWATGPLYTRPLYTPIGSYPLPFPKREEKATKKSSTQGMLIWLLVLAMLQCSVPKQNIDKSRQLKQVHWKKKVFFY